MTLVILGASPNVARVAGGLGLPLVHVLKPGSALGSMLRLGDRSYPVDYDDPAQWTDFVDTVLTALRPSAVVSITEGGLLPAAVASERLGTPGVPPEVVRLLCDKASMREHLTAHAPALTTWAGNVASPDIPAPTTESPLVAKPRRGTASESVRLVTSARELDRLRSSPIAAELVLESYVPGREFSVETFSRGGRHVVLAITEKVVGDTFVELGHVTPPRGLDAGASCALASATVTFLRAIGLEDGPAHTELKLHDGTVTVIESHNRPGGDRIPDLVRLTTGFDLRRWSLGWPVGLRPEDASGRAVEGLARAAAVAFVTGAPGVVTAAAAPASDDHEVLLFVGAGDRVGELRSSKDRIGSVLVAGDTSDGCLSEAQALAGRFHLETRDEVG